jgi:hypothetical protein
MFEITRKWIVKYFDLWQLVSNLNSSNYQLFIQELETHKIWRSSKFFTQELETHKVWRSPKLFTQELETQSLEVSNLCF